MTQLEGHRCCHENSLCVLYWELRKDSTKAFRNTAYIKTLMWSDNTVSLPKRNSSSFVQQLTASQLQPVLYIFLHLFCKVTFLKQPQFIAIFVSTMANRVYIRSPLFLLWKYQFHVIPLCSDLHYFSFLPLLLQQSSGGSQPGLPAFQFPGEKSAIQNPIPGDRAECEHLPAGQEWKHTPGGFSGQGLYRWRYQLAGWFR